MKNFLIFGVILFTWMRVDLAKGQSHSSMYHENGKLIVDTTLQINLKQLQRFSTAERYIMYHMTREQIYTPMAKENGVEGISIIAFDYEYPSIKNIRIIKKIGAGLDERIVEEIMKYSYRISQEFNYNEKNEGKEGAFNGTYYLPFDFTAIELISTMEKKNAIPIIDTKTPLIGR